MKGEKLEKMVKVFTGKKHKLFMIAWARNRPLNDDMFRAQMNKPNGGMDERPD